MSDLMSMLSQALGGSTVSQIAGQIGADESQTSSAINAALPILLGALDRNTDQPGGAESLFGALTRDHDGGILDDIGGFLGGAFGGSQAAAGTAILGNILGGKQRSVETGLSRASGLDMGMIAKLLPILAPIVMGVIGRLSRQQKLDANGVSGYLTRERERAQKTQPDGMAVLGNLLDSNNDGQVVDDIVKLGGGLLGSFFSQR
ncbi:MAG: hypothetical protein BMS9Abin37_2843 [Acidobacteriota bacterium]|nr:MAG: hypothetical protein BMS9Abin37_2843 [Acidobacteriota bacterium]